MPLLAWLHAAPNGVSHPPHLHGVNLCGRYQLKQISEQNKVQSTFRKWLRPVSQISQGLQGFCQLSIASCAWDRHEGERRWEGEAGWMSVNAQTVQSNQPMMLLVLSADRRTAENHPQATTNVIQNILSQSPASEPHTIPTVLLRGGEGGKSV